MKEGLNRVDIKKYHRMLKEDVPLKKIAKLLHTKVAVLKRLGPKAFEAAEKRKKEAEKNAKKEAADRKQQAADIAEATTAALKAQSENSDKPDLGI